jgi:hypothetical protein
MVDTNMELVVRNNIQQPDYSSKLTIVKGLKDMTDDEPAPTLAERRKRKKNSFTNWCMPAQPTGYIRSRKHDFL